MKKTLLVLTALFAMSGCNGNSGSGSNNTTPTYPNGTNPNGTGYAAAPQACGNNIPTSACVPINGGYPGGMNYYGPNRIPYGPGGYYGSYQGQMFMPTYVPMGGCPMGFMPVAGGAPYPGQFTCINIMYLQQAGVQPMQIPGAYPQGMVQGDPSQQGYGPEQQQGGQYQSQYQGVTGPQNMQQRGGGRGQNSCTINGDGSSNCRGENMVCEPVVESSGQLTNQGTCVSGI